MKFFASILAVSVPALLYAATSQEAAARLTHGPFLGHTTSEAVHIWARASEAGDYTLELEVPDGRRRFTVTTSPDDDLTLEWRIDKLKPERLYRYRIRRGPEALVSGEDLHLVTLPRFSEKTVLAIGSCADERRFPEQPIWTRIKESGAEALVLLGDTPYIDSTDLAVQRRRYREFFAVPELAALLGEIPLYATWDDHDFGADDTDGTIEGKAEARQAFLEYHAGPTAGSEGGEGIYTKFRRGPVEVFLLDTRWFAGTEESPFDVNERTLLGAAQWNWLEEELSASTATFKLICTGMVWNGAVRPGKKDHWLSYPYERDALFRLIGENKISGVVLVAGDIHRSRVLRHPTIPSAGYHLVELITSPLANNVIAEANQPSPYLLRDMGVEQTFLLVTADATQTPPTLHAQFLDAEGEELYGLTIDLEALSAR